MPCQTARKRGSAGGPRAGFVAWLVLVPAPVLGQVRFEEVARERGIGPHRPTPGMGTGVAVADFDQDGDLDFFLPQGEGTPDRLYRNRGDGNYEEIAAAIGLASTDSHRNALWFDYDGDGDLDLLVGGNDIRAKGEGQRPPLTLYERLASGQFVDVTRQFDLILPALETPAHFGGFSAGDLDRDGDLDLVVCIWGGRSRLFMNNRGRFVDRTRSSRVFSGTRTLPGDFEWQPLLHDFDGDGLQDIYLAVDFAPNRLMLNRGDGSFVDVAPHTGAANDMNDMGLTLGDYDGDGDFDLYVTNIDFFNTATGHNVLLKNRSESGSLRFVEVSKRSGVYAGGWGWGTTFLDVDNDTRLDLAATNGMPRTVYEDDVSRMFMNPGLQPVRFVDQAQTFGFADARIGSSLVAFDSDRDGDLDLLQTCMEGGPLRLLETELVTPARANHWLVVRPRMQDGGNRFAIGARVEVQVGPRRFIRLITAGTSFMGQEPAEAFFGLGLAERADEVRVFWPDGRRSLRQDVPADGVIVMHD